MFEEIMSFRIVYSQIDEYTLSTYRNSFFIHKNSVLIGSFSSFKLAKQRFNELFNETLKNIKND